MAINSTRLTTTGDTTLYTSSGGVNAVTLIVVCNTGTPSPSDETVDSCFLQLNLVKSGFLPSDANAIVKNLVIPAGETVFFSEERIVLDIGDTIRGTASNANLLSITVSTIAV
jgi:hypothetical protein